MRRSAWLKITIPIAFFVLISLAALIKVAVDRPPAYAQPAAIRARYGEQLDILRELARTNPVDDCLPEDRPEELVEKTAVMEPWWDRMETQRPYFADATILGAEVIRHCGGRTSGYGVKSFDAFAWSLPVDLTHREFPSVSLWYSGERRFVRYSDKITDDDGIVWETRLTLDLELLHPG